MKTQSKRADITATEKLNARVSANRHSSRDFDEWCFRQLPEMPLPARILDLGCGTGKQLLLFSPVLSPKSEIWGMDLSSNSLEQLKGQYSYPASLYLLEGDFDKLDQYSKLQDASFDLIYCAYALYYTKDLSKVLKDVYRLLKPGGKFWLISPYSGTNREFLDIIRPLHEVEPFMDYVFDTFPAEVVAKGEEIGFQSVKYAMLRNKVIFSDTDAFMHYLSHSLFYRSGHDKAIRKAVDLVCEQTGSFQVSKHIISIQLQK